VSEIEELREQELSEQDYHLLTQAAQESGVISTIDAYEPTSRLIDVAETLSPANEDINEFYPWYEHFFDDKLGFDEVSYDCKFCQLLRAGVEDAQVVLLFALLHNIRYILLQGGPLDVNSLEWRAKHKFASLREITVCGTEGDLPWPIGFFNPVLATASNLEAIHACAGSS
jgi:hypothetical protein